MLHWDVWWLEEEYDGSLFVRIEFDAILAPHHACCPNCMEKALLHSFQQHTKMQLQRCFWWWDYAEIKNALRSMEVFWMLWYLSWATQGNARNLEALLLIAEKSCTTSLRYTFSFFPLIPNVNTSFGMGLRSDHSWIACHQCATRVFLTSHGSSKLHPTFFLGCLVESRWLSSTRLGFKAPYDSTPGHKGSFFL